MSAECVLVFVRDEMFNYGGVWVALCLQVFERLVGDALQNKSHY